MTEHRDLVFADRPSRPLMLDLYRPDGDDPPPVVVWVHGGPGFDTPQTDAKVAAFCRRCLAAADYNPTP